MSRRWPITAVASLIGLSTIAAPTLVAVYLVDHSGAVGAPSTRDQAGPFRPTVAASPTAPASDVMTRSASASAPGSASVSILPPMLPSSRPSVAPRHDAKPDADIQGAVVTWSPAFDDATGNLPSVLRDGRTFAASAIIDARHVVGVATERATQERPQTSTIVIVDPVTAEVTATIDTLTNSARQVAQHVDETEIVGLDAVSGDWIGWLRGHQSDTGMSDATVYVADIVTGQRRVLEHVGSGDPSQLTPVLSGDFVAWCDPDVLHVSSLSSGEPVRTLPLAPSSGTTTIDALRPPWLSYETRAFSTPTYHLLDLRTGADQVVSGPCDGTWCEKADGRAISLVPQGSSGADRVIADRSGGSTVPSAGPGAADGEHAGFAGMADGFFLWTLADAPPPTMAGYLYDPSGDRDIALPSIRDGVVFVTGHYLVWEEVPAEPSPSGTLRFIDLDALRAALTNR